MGFRRSAWLRVRTTATFEFSFAMLRPAPSCERWPYRSAFRSHSRKPLTAIKKTPRRFRRGALFKILAVTYSHRAYGQTTVDSSLSIRHRNTVLLDPVAQRGAGDPEHPGRLADVPPRRFEGCQQRVTLELFEVLTASPRPPTTRRPRLAARNCPRLHLVVPALSASH